MFGPYIAVAGVGDAEGGRGGGANSYRSFSNTHSSIVAAKAADVLGNSGDELWIVCGNFSRLPAAWLRLVGVRAGVGHQCAHSGHSPARG